ncbi:MAG: hypothetical protein F4X44_09700 [Gammaproteobacteria bacterium]|nr:hypothetical protein [Gammaproteobacteria bacterium]MYD80871.1 hypothetical protein [Gammaproteobacteria bacterium]
MAAKLESELQASVELIAGGGGIFDVDVNGSIVYSKHQTGEFPDETSLVDQLRA